MSVGCLLASLLFLGVSFYGVAGEVHSNFDSVNPDPSKTYVFYSHGFIVEGDNTNPVHPRWGEYNFPGVVKALADAGFEVIAFHRPKGSDFKVYSLELASRVRQLLDKGVPATQVNLLGFSRGGRITAHASHALAKTPVNTIILAGCGAWVMKSEPWVKVNGDFLSVVEASDNVGTCQLLKNRSTAVQSYDEININTGEEHGAFYQPLAAWLNPVVDWIAAKARGSVQ